MQNRNVNIEVGAEYEGIVRRITDFGIFVELVPGTDGLLHISKIDRDLQNDLANNVPVGSTLQVKVMTYDKDRGRIGLIAPSIARKAHTGPSIDIEVGAEFEGVVRRITDFGIFVELVPGTDGLLHISQIDRDLQNDLANAVPVGSKLNVKVMSYDKEKGRIGLAAPAIGKK